MERCCGDANFKEWAEMVMPPRDEQWRGAMVMPPRDARERCCGNATKRCMQGSGSERCYGDATKG